jgi:hypothetical protein
MAKNAKGAEFPCSFCGKRHPAVKVIAGPGIFICAECVARCVEIAREGDGGVQSTAGPTRMPNRWSAFCLQFPEETSRTTRRAYVQLLREATARFGTTAVRARDLRDDLQPVSEGVSASYIGSVGR